MHTTQNLYLARLLTTWQTPRITTQNYRYRALKQEGLHGYPTPQRDLCLKLNQQQALLEPYPPYLIPPLGINLTHCSLLIIIKKKKKSIKMALPAICMVR